MSSNLFKIKGVLVFCLAVWMTAASSNFMEFFGAAYAPGGILFLKLFGLILIGLSLSFLIDKGARNPSVASSLFSAAFDLGSVNLIVLAVWENVMNDRGYFLAFAFLGSAITYLSHTWAIGRRSISASTKQSASYSGNTK